MPSCMLPPADGHHGRRAPSRATARPHSRIANSRDRSRTFCPGGSRRAEAGAGVASPRAPQVPPLNPPSSSLVTGGGSHTSPRGGVWGKRRVTRPSPPPPPPPPHARVPAGNGGSPSVAGTTREETQDLGGGSWTPAACGGKTRGKREGGRAAGGGGRGGGRSERGAVRLWGRRASSPSNRGSPSVRGVGTGGKRETPISLQGCPAGGDEAPSVSTPLLAGLAPVSRETAGGTRLRPCWTGVGAQQRGRAIQLAVRCRVPWAAADASFFLAPPPSLRKEVRRYLTKLQLPLATVAGLVGGGSKGVGRVVAPPQCSTVGPSAAARGGARNCKQGTRVRGSAVGRRRQTKGSLQIGPSTWPTRRARAPTLPPQRWLPLAVSKTRSPH